MAQIPVISSPSLIADERLVAPLRGARNASGFRGVYPHKGKWRAVVKWGGGEPNGGRLRHFPSVPHPQQAAEMYARWLRLRLGPRWAELIRSHKRNIWRRYAPFRAVYSDKYKGWILRVWVEGRPEEVAKGDRHRVFASWADAADYVVTHMERTHGEDWWAKLWR